VLCLVQTALYISGRDPYTRRVGKGSPQDHILFERWIALAHPGVIPYADANRWRKKGPALWWGIWPSLRRSQSDQLWLEHRWPMRATVITHFDGVASQARSLYLGNDVVNVGYHVAPGEDSCGHWRGRRRDVMSRSISGVGT